MKLLVKIVFSRWYLLVGVIASAAFILPANSPVGIPSDYKVIPAVLLVLVIMRLLPIWKDKEKRKK